MADETAVTVAEGYRYISGIERLLPDDALDARVFAFGDPEISAAWMANKHAAAKIARVRNAWAEVRRTWKALFRPSAPHLSLAILAADRPRLSIDVDAVARAICCPRGRLCDSGVMPCNADNWRKQATSAIDTISTLSALARDA